MPAVVGGRGGEMKEERWKKGTIKERKGGRKFTDSKALASYCSLDILCVLHYYIYMIHARPYTTSLQTSSEILNY